MDQQNFLDMNNLFKPHPKIINGISEIHSHVHRMDEYLFDMILGIAIIAVISLLLFMVMALLICRRLRAADRRLRAVDRRAALIESGKKTSKSAPREKRNYIGKLADEIRTMDSANAAIEMKPGTSESSASSHSPQTSSTESITSTNKKLPDVHIITEHATIEKLSEDDTVETNNSWGYTGF